MDYQSLSSTFEKCPSRGSVLLEISDFLLHAWAPLAAGGNIVLLHPFSLHFFFLLQNCPFIKRVYKCSSNDSSICHQVLN